MDPLAAIVFALPIGILIGLATFPWRHPAARQGWPSLLSLIFPPVACLTIGIVFAAPAGYRDMPSVVGALLWICTAASLGLGVYLVAFRLKRMRLSASMFTLGGVAGTLLAQMVAAMSVTANWI